MNIALGVLMILIYLFSSQTCADCCCIRCLFKTCTHVLWNVLALMLILSFLIGSLLGLIGTIGGDAMSLVSYIMSEENFDSAHPLILNKIDEKALKYIKRCIHEDGDISQELGLGDSLGAFGKINDVEGNITTAIQNFTRIQKQCITYTLLTQKLKQEASIDGETFLLSVKGENVNERRNAINYKLFLDQINNEASSNNRWDVTSPSKLKCEQSLSPDESYHPKYCQPYNKRGTQNDKFKKYSEVLKDIDDMVAYANDGTKTDSVISVIKNLKEEYDKYLGSYTGVLTNFLNIIKSITDLVRQYSGDDDAFSFLNGKFIGTNLKIILKYLKYSLGVDLYTVGVCLCVVGCSLALSISSTILLIVLINIELKKNQEMRRIAQTGGVTEFQTNVVQQNPTMKPEF